ncbi:hypothetical protein Tco_1366624 [Tanacetum coccineum]
MLSDNASSTVTYTSISSDSNGPSWGIPIVNADELPKMDPYEEVAQQGQVEDQPYTDDASLTAESPGYIADSDSMEEDSIDYLDEPKDDDKDLEEDDDEDPEEDPSEDHEPEDDDEDPEEDPSEEHEPKDDDEDHEEDPSEEHKPEDEDTKEEEPSEGSDDTEPFKEYETTLIDVFAAGSPLFPLPPTSPAYDQAPLCDREAMIRMRNDILEEDMPPRRRFVLTAPPPRCDVAESSVAAIARIPRGQYDFVDTIEVGHGLVRSPSHNAWIVGRATDRAEDVELHEVHHAYLSSEARNMALLARLETLETHMSRMEWQRQSAKDFAIRQMMRT